MKDDSPLSQGLVAEVPFGKTGGEKRMLVLSFSFSTKLPAVLQHRELKRNKQKASLILQANLLAKEQNSTPGRG